MQDYLYVQSFIRLIGATLAKAPTEDIGPLAKGIIIVNAELEWFKGKAKERQIDLDTKGKGRCVLTTACQGSLARTPP